MDTEKPGRGRRRQFDLDDALQQAQRQFHLHGYEGARMSDICAGLGITQTSLYAAFGSKLELYGKVIDRYASTDAQFITNALDTAATPDELWDGILSGAAEAYGRSEAPGCLVLGADVSALDDGARSLLQQQASLSQQAIAARLKQIGSTAPDADAAAIMTLLRGLSASARAGARHEALSSSVNRILGARHRRQTPSVSASR
ncbi:MAG: TetR/AcrR family transcriptional regulator [Tabrizicola sp.]|nr:TetR/AcrR family transcriptional regulator [Tabrizicola sp.]